MTEIATVKTVEGDEVTVVCKTEESCAGCSGLFCSADAHAIHAVKDSGLEVKTGDLVDLYIPPGKTMFQGFIVLVMPLILFITAFVIGGRIITDATEGIQVLFGLVGLAIGFGASFLYGKSTKKNSMPKILGPHTQQQPQTV